MANAKALGAQLDEIKRYEDLPSGSNGQGS